MDPISESKKPSDIPSDTEVSDETPPVLADPIHEADISTKDGQSEPPSLPDTPELGSRPIAERPKPRNDEIQLPDMPKF